MCHILHNLNPLISVIIPTYNRAASLSSCLASLTTQTTSNFEIIVSDDGSTDRTPSVVEAFMDKLPIRLLRNPNSGGPARPRNHAARHAVGTILTFLDSDDTAAPDKLAQIESIEALEWDIAYHPLRRTAKFFLPLVEGKLVGQNPIQGDPFRYLLDHGNPIALSGASVRKATFDDIGGFDESPNLHALEDFDFWLRAARNGANFIHIEKILGRYQESRSQLSKSLGAKSNLVFLVERYNREINFVDPGKSAWVHFGISRIKVINSSLFGSIKVIVQFAKRNRSVSMLLRLTFLTLVSRLLKSRT